MKYLKLLSGLLLIFNTSILSAQHTFDVSQLSLEKLKSISSKATQNNVGAAVQGECYPHACWGKVQAVDMWGGNLYHFQLDLPQSELSNANCTRAQKGIYPTFTLDVSHPKSYQIQEGLVHSINTDNYAWVDFVQGSKDCLVNGVRIFKY